MFWSNQFVNYSKEEPSFDCYSSTVSIASSICNYMQSHQYNYMNNSNSSGTNLLNDSNFTYKNRLNLKNIPHFSAVRPNDLYNYSTSNEYILNENQNNFSMDYDEYWSRNDSIKVNIIIIIIIIFIVIIIIKS
jgi:hypothetical protein